MIDSRTQYSRHQTLAHAFILVVCASFFSLSLSSLQLQAKKGLFHLTAIIDICIRNSPFCFRSSLAHGSKSDAKVIDSGESLTQSGMRNFQRKGPSFHFSGGSDMCALATTLRIAQAHTHPPSLGSVQKDARRSDVK